MATVGRVLNFISLSEEFVNAKKNILNHINMLDWQEGFFRKDIGYKVIDEWELFLETLREKKY